ncbi:hybrid sensor histidine kinase/response regulator [Nostoc sp. 'Peltigera membranacea cyanobiont' 213]|uniref:hybrid sensor histidine kinase/response regulator n=1 Tax=Nostoc sp. 'Peltigera membranacea cyanobiont' 213 TaxID=2014530 RepID=UPI000B950AFF|nr:hybrid sensor histidine kinase/response regulator [Nostoc sp. 'Peltigera membranacea cyanobiont' 213]OYD98745.1 hybrid sensor histidine kinase/response regulator [Nostoc sp. 'Peltigera membranacea cyanobiont' 213]
MLEEFDVSNLSLLDLFNMEVKAQVVVLNDRLLALETKPDPQPELAALMRAAHCIKGAARIVQIDPAVNLAHVMEDCFVAAQEGKVTLTADRIDVLLQGVDMLLRIAETVTANPNLQMLEDVGIQSLVSAIANILTLEATSTEIHPLVTTAQLEDNQQTTLISPSPLEELGITQNRAVRMSTENLNRLMGLAGESLVEANLLEPFANSLLKLRSNQGELSNLLEKLQELLGNYHLDRQIKETLSATHQKANECYQMMSDRQNELEQFSQRSANLAQRLYQEVIATRMCSFADGGQGFPRMVRDLARQLSKRVKLEIVGKSTLVDRDILERLEAPLTHILRNAIDHGIELPQERLAAGKPEEGIIRIEVTHRAGMLFITVADDGRGIDIEFLRQVVIGKQLTNPEMAAQLTEVELMEFLFLPGFSTTQTVTEISGRGVGLDIAHSAVREVGGTLRAVSVLGRGMTFHLQLPLTLSVIRTLLVEIAGEPYAFGLTRIEQVLILSKSKIAVSENRPFFVMNNQPVELIMASQVLELASPAVNMESLSVIVISDRFNRYGLVVDRFLGECNLVVRPLDPRLGKVPNISAAALMDDGSPVLIVDVEDLVRSIAKVFSSGQLSQVNQSAHQAVTKTYKRVLVVDDSITVREMERKLLENNGYKAEVAVNGIDGWNAIRSGDYDLVVTDIDMPRMNGFELTSQIKTHAKLKQIPVIIVSYKDREEDRLQGLEAGADYYLTKSSFHDDTLLKAVIDLIGEA